VADGRGHGAAFLTKQRLDRHRPGMKLVVILQVLLGDLGDAHHHLHGLQRELADRRLAGQHHRVRAIEDRIRHIGSLGARGPRVLDHAVEHLRRSDHRLARGIAPLNDVLLVNRHTLGGRFDAKIAARHHDRVRLLQNRLEIGDGFRLLDLGDQRRVPGQVAHQPAHLAQIVCCADERHRHIIDLLRQRKPHVFPVGLGDRRQAERRIRHAHAFVRVQQPAGDHLTQHVRPHLGANHQLKLTIIEQQPLAQAQITEQIGVRQRDHERLLRIEDDAIRQRQDVALGDLDRILHQPPEPQLGALDVGDDSHDRVLFFGQTPDVGDIAGVCLVVAVTHVDPRHIHAGTNHRTQHPQVL